MQVFTAASHHDVFALIVQIAVLLLAARLLGEASSRLGQPSVVGEIMAGVLLGPSLLGHFVPELRGIIIPATPVQGYLLEVISLLGVMFLLFMTGLEIDLKLIRAQAKVAFGAAAGGLVLPLVTGFLLGQYLPDYLLADESQRFVFSLFLATAMAISAIPVIAKVLFELKLMRRNIGQTIVAAGMVDDTTGWILLSIVAALAAGSQVTAGGVLGSIGTVVTFIAISFVFGRWVLKRLVDYVQDELKSPDRLLTLAIAMAFGWGALSHALNLEPMLGAFVMGILFGQLRRFPHAVRETLATMTMAIFAPIFFAVAGLKVNAVGLLRPDMLVLTLVVILTAVFGKVAGAYAGARLIGKQDHWTALAYGAALNARGAMEIIVATIGLSLGILSQDMFSIIVIMAVVTSLMAPWALRVILKRIAPAEEELRRLAREELSAGSAVANLHRVLLPMRKPLDTGYISPVQRVKWYLIERLSNGRPLSVTLFSVVTGGHLKAESLKYLNGLQLPVKQQAAARKVAENTDVSAGVLEEARKDYDALILGASEPAPNSDNLFSPVIDELVTLAPCTTVVVHAPQVLPAWKPKKILVPTNGSAAAKTAVELAFLLAHSGEKVFILNVVTEKQTEWGFDIYKESFDRQVKIAQDLVGRLQHMGNAYHVAAQGEVRIGKDPESEILSTVMKEGIDLIILGTDVRPASERLFLGPRVERIIKSAPCPVVVLNAG